jgi:glucose/arabinose dehydrogenase
MSLTTIRTQWSALIIGFCLLCPILVQAEITQLQFNHINDKRGIVDISNAGDGSNRVFLVEQLGQILILEKGEIREAPFLDIRSRVMSGDEQGLLSLAFAPDYPTSGYFYVWYSKTGGSTVLSRFRVTEEANLADPNSEELILAVAQPYANHNGGRLQFGPDGMLYLGLGDGGSANDPENRAQDGNSLLGKLIRIDVDPIHDTYAIPPDNPFVNDNNVFSQIWATGLRNPWKISFDSETGDLFIADVGQNALEEVNFQPASSSGGENYGWKPMEGTRCNTSDCSQGFTLPVAEYSHQNGCSITGGEVYRGNAYPEMIGTYLYADWCSGNVWGLARNGNQWQSTLLGEYIPAITTFGLGEDGSIYAASTLRGIFLVSDGEVVPESFRINAGINDAWFDPATDGQGFFINVFPQVGQMFMSWFTYEVERPDESVPANLGEAGHRWLTAQGSYVDNKAVLDIYITAGGVFDQELPVTHSTPDGTMIVEFSDCKSGTVTFDIPSIGKQGTVSIMRVAEDNVPLCESLAAEVQ